MNSDDTESSGAEPEDTQPQEGAPPPEGAAAAAATRVTLGEQLIALGGLLIVLVTYLLGDVILDEHGFSTTMWLIVVLAIVAIWAHRFSRFDVPGYRWLVVVLGLVAGLLGAKELLDDLESAFLEGAYVFFAISLYVGAALMAVGAVRVWRSSDQELGVG